MQRGMRKRNEDYYQINSLVPDPFETHRFIHLDPQQLSFGKEKNREGGRGGRRSARRFNSLNDNFSIPKKRKLLLQTPVYKDIVVVKQTI